MVMIILDKSYMDQNVKGILYSLYMNYNLDVSYQYRNYRYHKNFLELLRATFDAAVANNFE